MDIKELNKKLNDALKVIEEIKEIVNEEQMNESPVTKKASVGQHGENYLFDEPQDINTIIDRCNYLFEHNPDVKGCAQVKDLWLDCDIPIVEEHIHKPVTIIYGNSKMGVKHVLERRGEEFTKKTIGERLSKEEVITALKELPNALINGAILIDYDLKGADNKVKRNIRKTIKPMPYGDRIIIDYKGIFYTVLIEGLDGKTDVTCPLTMFKPSAEYRQRIEYLNEIK